MVTGGRGAVGDDGGGRGGDAGGAAVRPLAAQLPSAAADEGDDAGDDDDDAADGDEDGGGDSQGEELADEPALCTHTERETCTRLQCIDVLKAYAVIAQSTRTLHTHRTRNMYTFAMY